MSNQLCKNNFLALYHCIVSENEINIGTVLVKGGLIPKKSEEEAYRKALENKKKALG